LKILNQLQGLLKRRAVKDGLGILLDHGQISIAMFLTGVLVARGTSKEMYGIYVLMISLLINIQGSHRALIGLPFTVLLPKLTSARKNALFGNTLVFTFLFLSLVIPGLGLSVYLLHADTTPTPVYSIAVAAIFSLTPFIFREYFRAAMLAALNVWGAIIPNLLASSGHIAAVVILYYTGQLSAQNAFFVLAAFSCISAILIFTQLWKTIGFDKARLLSDFYRFWYTGKWNLTNIFWHICASQIYPWLVVFFIDTEAVAVYGACYAVSALLSPLLRGINAYILPRMAHSLNAEKPGRFISITKQAVLAISIPFGIWLVIGLALGNELLTLIYSTSYSDYGLLLKLLVLMTFVEALSVPATNALLALEKSRAITGSYVTGSIVTFGPGLLLIAYYGVVGAGIATVLSSLASGLYKWIVLWRYLRSSTK
jgi:O-antigen/teichoic acid export membrane protein